MKTSADFRAAEAKLLNSFFDCNSLIKLASVRVIMDHVCYAAVKQTEESLLCLLCISLTVWMSTSLRHFSQTKKGLKFIKSLRPGLPSTTVTNLIYCLVL